MPRAVPHVPPPLTGPLILWLLPQLLMLGVCAGGLTWSRAQPLPADRLTLHLVVSVQIIVLFLLFPMLLNGWRKVVVIAAASGPIWVAAMILSGMGWPAMLSSAGYVLLWMAALWPAALNLKNTRTQLHSCTLASIWLGIGPLLWYLRAESGVNAKLSTWSPLTAVLGLLNDPNQVSPFAIPLTVALLAGVIFLIRRRFIENQITSH